MTSGQARFPPTCGSVHGRRRQPRGISYFGGTRRPCSPSGRTGRRRRWPPATWPSSTSRSTTRSPPPTRLTARSCVQPPPPSAPTRTRPRPSPPTAPSSNSTRAARDDFDAVLDDTLGPVRGRAGGRPHGVALGQAVAERGAAVAGRGREVPARSGYAPRAGPGRWQPTPPDHRPPLLPGWAARPVLRPPGAGRVPPARPAGPRDSAEYAAALPRGQGPRGGRQPGPDGREQTEVAHFWADGEGTVTPPGHWNRIAQAVAAGPGADAGRERPGCSPC